MKLGTFALRATIGSFFIGHGAQKLFGYQEGPGLKGTAQMMEGLGLKPPIAHATLAAVGETAGGAGLLLGYHTPLSAAAVIGSMTTAIHRVHGKNGWNVQSGGFEYNAVLIAGCVAIAEQGPGFLSLDALRGKQRSGLFWGLFALGAGVAGSLGTGAASGYFGGTGLGGAPESSESNPEASPEPLSQPVGVEEVLVEPQGEPLPVEPLGGDPVGGDPIEALPGDDVASADPPVGGPESA